MLKNSFVILILLAFACILANFFMAFDAREGLEGIAAYYATNAADEVGAANLVSSVVVTYRGFDTLGELSILFLTSSILGFFLKTNKKSSEGDSSSKSIELLQSGAQLLVPFMILFGVYVFVNGHLSPGGGFQGGAIIATALVFHILANPNHSYSHKFISIIESISGLSFLFIGLLGIFLAGGFLDNTIIGLGRFGTLISAGAMPLLYLFIGLKVGAELTAVISNFQENQKEA